MLEGVVEDVEAADVVRVDGELDGGKPRQSVDAADAHVDARDVALDEDPLGVRGQELLEEAAELDGVVGHALCVIPLEDPSKFGFAMTGYGSSSRPPARSDSRVRSRPRGLGIPKPASSFLVSALSSVTHRA